jgi:uncharacterized protein involved in exopolysaccharide biosynthesis
LTNSDQRTALLEVLSGQEQIMTMLDADKRYASSVIDGPYAPLLPSWPNLLMIVVIAMVLSGVTWIGLVLVFPESTPLARIFSSHRFGNWTHRMRGFTFNVFRRS